MLQRSGKAIEVWSYSQRLQLHLEQRLQSATHSDLREHSSVIVAPEDIAAVDEKLIAFVEERRGAVNVIIDSHPVTKEPYGFRVTAFSLAQIQALAPDEIWVTFAGAAETVARIAMNPQGRPLVGEETASMHTGIQAAVATTYGILSGRPVYLFDTGLGSDVQIKKMVSRLG